jgi:oxygen-independent coproporphyrinogen-3 oxidase
VDVGLYVHVPFCPTRCGYCDFYSLVPRPGDCDPLVDALLAELRTRLGERAFRVETLFVGGGTPTFLPPAPFERLFDALGQVAAEHAVAEFSVEANPASLNDEKARLLRRAGVHRISMGAQSFDRRELRMLERLHDPDDIAAGAEVVRRAGFEHFNLDLIFGIPGQTLASWTASLRRAVELGPDHLACYGLTYEPGTPLHAKRAAGGVVPVPAELEADMYLATEDELVAMGYAQYEISNYARSPQTGDDRARCLHNLRYWRNQPGVGIGPSAASYLDGRRWRNVPDAAEYARRVRSGVELAVDAEALSPLERAGEAAMLRLRLVEGLSRSEFQRDTGFDPWHLFDQAIARHVEAGLLAVHGDRAALTRQGRLVGDQVMADFLAPRLTPQVCGS